MKQNKLLILSLLASFLLLFSASYSTAQNAVTFGTVDDCPKPADATVTVPVLIDNDVDLAALDIIGQVVSDGNVDLVVTGISFADYRLDDINILDQRYPIGDLGGGIFRLGAVKMTGVDLASGSGQIATVTLKYLSDCQLGTANLDPASVDVGGVPTSTNFVDPDANQIDPTVNAGAVNAVNTPPSFTDCPGDAEIYWGDTYSQVLHADDPDLACGCDALKFYVDEGPGSIGLTNGLYTFTATAPDVGCQHVKIRVQDNFGGVAYCEFTISVLNHPPEITCPDEVINILWGQTAAATVTAIDPDSGPSGLTFSLIDPGSYPGSPEINPATGEFTWVTDEDNAFLGTFEFCAIVTDGANVDECNLLNADTCCFTVHVDPKFRVTIEKVHNQLQGHYAEVAINLDDSYTSMNMGGYDLLIAYDVGLTFISATPGQLLTDCDWEYFTYRFGATGNCGDQCPSGVLRLVAMAETNNGANHPTCFNSATGTELAVLEFFVSNDRTLECQYLPVRFYWMDCADNTISSQYGDTLFLDDKVLEFEGNEITDHTFGFPGYYGALDSCLVGDKLYPLRAIDFKNGGVDVVCGDSIDVRGDINANGIGYEIADAVMFTGYFISGLSAFGGHIEASIAASDVNADGITLSVADLVYLVRVIQGDAQPYAKPGPAEDNFSVSTQVQTNQLNVAYDATTSMGAVWMRFQFTGSVEAPVLGDGASNMELKYGINGNELNVLVFDLGNDAILAGQHNLVTIPVNGDIKLVEVDAADFNGNMVNMFTRSLPSKFALAQNHPNPFNPTTSIELALPIASDYSVTIYNVAGQVIRTYSGYANAGVVSIEWDGRDASGSQVASGMYFYKAVAGQFSATKKMLLMK
jgi:hypothetical protein